jgi:hypothetical protein
VPIWLRSSIAKTSWAGMGGRVGARLSASG